MYSEDDLASFVDKWTRIDHEKILPNGSVLRYYVFDPRGHYGVHLMLRWSEMISPLTVSSREEAIRAVVSYLNDGENKKGGE